MTNLEILDRIASESDVILRKFRMVRAFSDFLRAGAVDTAEFSPPQVEAQIRKMLLARYNGAWTSSIPRADRAAVLAYRRKASYA